MSDTAAATPKEIRQDRIAHKVTGGLTLIFSAVTIVYLIAYGVPTNSLHASALSWSFMLAGVVLASFGFPAAVDLFKGRS